jgi:hypothetical protein
MRGGTKRVLIGAVGGAAAVALTFGSALLVVYAPAWLAACLPLTAIFAGGAFAAVVILGDR